MKVVLSYKIRTLQKEEPFWTAFGCWFQYSRVVRQLRALDGDDDENLDDIWIFSATRLPSTIGIDVAVVNDAQLMHMLGTDDTFEQMLLLKVDI